MGAMLTPEEMQDAYPLPDGWYWAHDDEGWNAYETRGTRVDIALAVILANMGRGSLESIETDRDDARRSYCEQIEDPPPPTPAKV